MRQNMLWIIIKKKLRTGTDFITKSLGYVDKEFRAKHGFSEQTRKAFSKYEHLVQWEKEHGAIPDQKVSERPPETTAVKPAPPVPDAFLSYTRFDDQNDGGAISEFRMRLANEVRAVTGKPFEIFQDIDGIGLGEKWSGKLDQILDQARFFIPIITPNYFTSEACRDEIEKFLRAEADRGRSDLVLPIYYIECDVLEDRDLRSADPLATAIHERQRQDWRHLRFETFADRDVRRALEGLARQITRARHRAVPQPPEKAGCPELVEIPPGKFMMGYEERPQHEVRIGSRFAVGRYPVTFEEYDCFAAETGREQPNDRNWGRGRRPVINVSWNDAKAYVEWLSQVTGQPYRLPSEAEWEYAARAGTTTRYSWGNDNITAENANYGRSVGKTTEVGTYPANPWGLHDMHGNVSEWVEDCWNDSYQGAPSDGSAWTSGDCRLRVRRGGSWINTPEFLRSADRLWDNSDLRNNYVGFRVARTLR
jgi:formylglycine-generating enzyme required for sulfatase activity